MVGDRHERRGKSGLSYQQGGRLAGFQNALSTFRTISQNFVYADTDGNIGLMTGGGIPVKKLNGNMVRKGETDEFDWKGYVPLNELPYSFNPERGYVSSANNKTVSEDYPYYISTGMLYRTG